MSKIGLRHPLLYLLCAPNHPYVLFIIIFFILGLSTALANAKDLADWLGIEGQTGLYNFRPSVRPVPLEVHISGYPGKHYCPRMISMNKPAFQAIQQHSPNKPTLIFVSSRRQTRLTALDLIALSGNIFNLADSGFFLKI
jgi:replicative superfamily II helicase